MQAPTRPYHHGNLRETLLRAAESTLEARGVTSLSLRELAREIGVSHTSPRRHFADKQALLDALAISGFERLDATLARELSGKNRTLSTQLTRHAQTLVAFALKHPALWALMFEAKHRPGAPAELLEASLRAFSHLPSIIRQGQEAGEIVPGDPWRLSLTLNAALQGLVGISSKGKFKGFPLDVLVPETVKRILLGLKPR